jgi:alpha-beta hydrolase superfamily lysophospholipase
MVTLPALDGVDHKYVDLGDGVTIHVADAGPPEGPQVMLVHGFPENWWEWHELIGPLAADGYRVLCPDLRGAGWSSAPRSRYLKNDMADDLAAVLDRLGRRAGETGGPRLGRAGRVHHDAAASGEGDRLLRTQQRDLSSMRNAFLKV